MYGQQNPAVAYGGYPSGTVNQQQGQQQQASTDVYQAAYAQAYAQLQAQFQAAYAAPPQPYGTAAHMPAFAAQYYPQSGSAGPPTPPMPFPGMAGAPAAPFPPSAAGSDDGLANVLMAWYQSGYYTGRFQAMQEMKMQGRR
ncbi:unnamed protein product [Phytophthora fragariaefolia]|uniref:Unnamed protein product n=1 Tax=Phytophthora fragariaefolia TaxID=1490495 RepID=A0A9W6Y807_9STRA|nr:unnamed protein product [Phytophthora fragariaefolia]